MILSNCLLVSKASISPKWYDCLYLFQKHINCHLLSFDKSFLFYNRFIDGWLRDNYFLIFGFSFFISLNTYKDSSGKGYTYTFFCSMDWLECVVSCWNMLDCFEKEEFSDFFMELSSGIDVVFENCSFDALCFSNLFY